MEKRQRIAIMVVLTRYNRWLENRGVIKSTAVADRLLAEYVKSLTEPKEGE